MQTKTLQRLEHCLFLLEAGADAPYEKQIAEIDYNQATDEYTIIRTSDNYSKTIRANSAKVGNNTLILTLEGIIGNQIITQKDASDVKKAK